MGEHRLFQVSDGKAHEIERKPFGSERELQKLFEANLDALLGVRFVASEFQAGSGRIDTLGIDENNFPTVVEYKLDKNKTVINQGMAYMAWLKSHSAEFWKAVFGALGEETANAIDDSSMRLICIASEFTREDLGAYELMPNNIDLVRYVRFGESHIMLERIRSDSSSSTNDANEKMTRRIGVDKPFDQVLREWPEEARNLFEEIKSAILSQGDDVVEKMTKLYLAFKRIRNFATLTNAAKGEFNLYLHVDPRSIQLRDNMRDVSKTGHWGTGDLEVRIRNREDLESAIPLIKRAYEGM